MKNENIMPLVQKLWRILRQRQQSIEPSTGAPEAWGPLWLPSLHIHEAGSTLNTLRASYSLKNNCSLSFSCTHFHFWELLCIEFWTRLQMVSLYKRHSFFKHSFLGWPNYYISFSKVRHFLHSDLNLSNDFFFFFCFSE